MARAKKKAPVDMAVFRIQSGLKKSPTRVSPEVENHRVRQFVQCASKVRDENGRNQIWFDHSELKEALYMRSDARITYNRESVFEAEVEKEGMRYVVSRDGKYVGMFVYSEENEPDISYEAMEKFFTVAGRPDEL